MNNYCNCMINVVENNGKIRFRCIKCGTFYNTLQLMIYLELNRYSDEWREEFFMLVGKRNKVLKERKKIPK